MEGDRERMADVSLEDRPGETYGHIPGVENLNQYCRGDYHFVHIRDKFHKNKYVIVHKLGHGDTSTAWLAENTERKTCLTISILKADISRGDETKGIKYLQRLSNGNRNCLGRANILLPLDLFELHGPNGIIFA